MMRFDRFTERAQEAAQRAAEIIQRYGHTQIDTEHILLALIEQPEGAVTQILEILKVDAEALTERLDYIFLKARENYWKVLEARHLETPGERHSDHRVVLLRLAPVRVTN